MNIEIRKVKESVENVLFDEKFLGEEEKIWISLDDVFMCMNCSELNDFFVVDMEFLCEEICLNEDSFF